MKRKLIVVSCIIMIIMSIAVAHADFQDCDIAARVCNCNEYITLRKWPSTKAPELERLYFGEPVFILSRTAFKEGDADFVLVESIQEQLGYVLLNYVELIKTRPIVEGVAEELGLDYTYEQLMSMIDLKVVPNTRIIKISVTSPDKGEARDMANALAVKAETELPKLMDAPKPNIAEKAITPEHKSSPSLTKNTLIGALALMLIVLAVLTVMYLMDDTVKTADDVEKNFGVMPLTTIPEGKIEGLESTSEEHRRRGGLLGLLGMEIGKKHKHHHHKKEGGK